MNPKPATQAAAKRALACILVTLFSGSLGLVSAALAGVDVDVRIQAGGSPSYLVPVPIAEPGVELWSDPGAGSLVYPGDRASLYIRTRTDCYLTVLSIDTEGRARLLFPSYHDDGWVHGGRTVRVPERGAGYDLRFAGPTGIEYVYAISSLEPTRDRYPGWLVDGRVCELDSWSDDSELYDIGWVVGDPVYELRGLCRSLVAHPDCPETYASAWLSFCVGRRVDYPRTLCRDCHGFANWDPYSSSCPAVTINLDGSSCSGFVDFRVAFVPRWWYRPCGSWPGRRSRGHGDHDGRWSSADGPRRLRSIFKDSPERRKDDRRDEWVDDGRGGRHEWDRGRDEREKSREDEDRKKREVRDGNRERPSRVNPPHAEPAPKHDDRDRSRNDPPNAPKHEERERRHRSR